MDCGSDVHFTKNRCWIAKDDGKELDMIRSGGVFLRCSEADEVDERFRGTGTQSHDPC